MLLIRQSLLLCHLLHLYNEQIKGRMRKWRNARIWRTDIKGLVEAVKRDWVFCFRWAPLKRHWLALCLCGQRTEAASVFKAVRPSVQYTQVFGASERTNEWMNEWTKDGSKSFLFLTFTTAAWSHALMNNGNHLTWALCELSFPLLVSLSLFLISNTNVSFLELLIFISLSFQFESFSNM